jgi:RNA polymerase sigma-70 factor (ECF subfamily)
MNVMAITTTFDTTAAPRAAGDAAAREREDAERSLVARARKGDREAFRGLVERHQGRALALARRLLRDEAEAEEVAQDAFLKAWSALPGFRAEASFGTWLHRIVYRRALDRLDALKVRRRHEATAPSWPEEGAVSDDPGGPGDERVRRLVESLPAPQRAAVTLYYFEDRSVQDAATVLGMHENTMKTHLHRARAALRAAWAREEEGTR